MARSFTDRVLGGVCGGMAQGLRVSAWTLRAAFAALALASLGGVALWYAVLWWYLPQEAPYEARRRPGALLPLVLLLLALGITAGAYLVPLTLYLPGALAAASLLFFLRQLGG